MTTFSLDNIDQTQTTATLQAYVTWLRDCLVSSGWVQTADTGQFNPATITAPTANQFVSGSLMFRMDDALQSVFPLILKLEVGTGSNVSNPALRITLGSATNGAGVFVGNTIGGLALSIVNVPSGGANKLMRASGANNRFTCMLWGQQVGVAALGSGVGFWSVERTHNPDGSDNADGVMLMQKVSSISSQPVVHNVLLPSSISQNPAGLPSAPLSTLDTTTLITTVRGLTAGAYPIYPLSARPTLAAMNALAYIDGDFTTLVPLSVNHFGGLRSYLPLGKYNVTGVQRNATSNDIISSLMMRWE